MKYLSRLSLSLILGMGIAAPAFAVGEEDTPPKPTETTKECPDGEIWDKDSKSCIKSSAAIIDDDQRYDAVRELAYADRHKSALMIIETAQAKDSPRFLTYRGFSLRKMGDMEGAMTFYRQALAIDPDYILARSYMAQGLLQQGQRDLALAQLSEIEARGGKESWAHRSLKMALNGEYTDY